MSARNLPELLAFRASAGSDRAAYTYLSDGEHVSATLTWAQLDRRARAIGARLQAMGVEGRAPLVFSPGLEFVTAFFGAMYGGLVAVPTPGPSQPLHRTLKRLAAIADDAKASVVLTTSSLAGALDALKGPENAAILAIDAIGDDEAEAWRERSPAPEDLAFLQYTSGSTAAPKGVMVSHANLLHNLAFLQDGWQHGPRSVGVSWLPIFHDMGLVDAVLQPLWNDFPSVLMPPVAFLKHPLRWLQAIARYRGTYTSAPNFAFDLCVRKSTPEQRAALDLSSWDAALIAAEPVRASTMRRFADAFEVSGFRWGTFRPGFGLAEGTLKVCGMPPGRAPMFATVDGRGLEEGRAETPANPDTSATLAGCGDVRVGHFGQRVAIVDVESVTETGTNRVGEIWVSGPSVAQGYWQRPDASAQTFGAYLANGEGPFLRTGDLGFVRDDQLFVTGRMKDLVILFGRNVYPQDVERAAEESHPALRPGCSAAFAIDEGEQERLVVVAEVDARETFDADEITRAVTRAAGLQLDVSVYRLVLVKAGTIPKTSSGKIQRHACRTAFLAGALELEEGPRRLVA